MASCRVNVDQFRAQLAFKLLLLPRVSLCLPVNKGGVRQLFCFFAGGDWFLWRVVAVLLPKLAR
jgi:hypothetical protein